MYSDSIICGGIKIKRTYNSKGIIYEFNGYNPNTDTVEYKSYLKGSILTDKNGVRKCLVMSIWDASEAKVWAQDKDGNYIVKGEDNATQTDSNT